MLITGRRLREELPEKECSFPEAQTESYEELFEACFRTSSQKAKLHSEGLPVIEEFQKRLQDKPVEQLQYANMSKLPNLKYTTVVQISKQIGAKV